jgi:hypothetical protein
MTGREFEDEMADSERGVKAFIDMVYKKHKTVFGGTRENIRLLMDNAPQHKSAAAAALLDRMALTADCLVQHPPNSFDFQLPIEWANGGLKRAAREYLYQHPEVKTVDELLPVLNRLWKELFPAAIVRQMFEKQLQTYSDIIENGGGYARKSLC